MKSFKKTLAKWPSYDLGYEHTLYVAPVADVMRLLRHDVLVNWRYNRPFDEVRVEEISACISDTGYVSGTIKLAQIGDSDELVVYDGVHRLLALTGKVETVLLDVILNTTDQRVKEEFVTVNKAVPVSELYTEDNVDEDVKLAIEGFVEDLCKGYKFLVSASKSCHRPHFNPDVLKSDVYDLYLSGKDDIETVLCIIDELNILYKRGFKDGVNPLIRSKCERTGLYLFCEGRTIHRDKYILAKFKREERQARLAEK